MLTIIIPHKGDGDDGDDGDYGDNNCDGDDGDNPKENIATGTTDPEH